MEMIYSSTISNLFLPLGAKKSTQTKVVLTVTTHHKLQHETIRGLETILYIIVF